MDFNKITQEIVELQNKVEAYEKQNNKIKVMLNKLCKEKNKLKNKLEKETIELNKLYIQINLYFIDRLISDIEKIYVEDDKNEKDKSKSV